MKRIAKTLLVALVAVIGVVLTGCNPEPEAKKFSLQFTGFGPGYVSVNVTVPGATTVAYMISTEPLDEIDQESLNAQTDTHVTFYSDGPHQLLDYTIEEYTKYYVYLTALLGDDYSQLYTYEFETEEFTFNQMATVVGVAPDGYKMYIQVPPSVKNSVPGTPGSRAIRYTQGDLMIYNFYKDSSDDTYSLLYNGGRFITEDTMVEYSDALNYGEAGADINEDGKVDENDMSILWNPIAPGEPVVFLAGEFEWMSEPAEYKKGGALDGKTYFVNGFPFPGGWEDGYYLPCVDGAKYWVHYGKNPDGTDKDDKTEGDKTEGDKTEGDKTEDDKTESEDSGSTEAPATPAVRGAGIINNIDLTSPIDAFWKPGSFQRKIFRTLVPAKLDGDFEVKVENLRSVDATLTITPTKKIFRYLFTVLDEGAYNQMLELLDGKTEYLQWAVTSYFAMYNFGQIQVVYEEGSLTEDGWKTAPPIEFNLTDFFYDVPSDTKYHVLITGMSGDIGSPQCFKHYTFKTPAKTKTKGPNIVVTPLPDKCSPYEAVFNVKCTSVANNKAVRCYYGANYKMDWIHKVNSGNSYTYEYLGQTNQFTAAELSQINSEEGLTLRIPTIDGETTRLVVVAFNDENISNGVDKPEDVTEHPAVADCTTPYQTADDLSYNTLLDTDKLVGEWTMSATVVGGATMKQKVNIKRRFSEGIDYPKDTIIPADVKAIYKKATTWTDSEIQGFYSEFRDMIKIYNSNRLRYQNRLLIEGWIDDSQGSLTYLSPWDLFKHEKISMADVPSMFARFGPKIYLNVQKKDGANLLSVSANNMFVSPIAQWSVPFYMAGRRADQNESNTIFQWSDDYGNWTGALTFPVTLAEDHNTITIHALEYAGVKYYPNVVGISEGYGGTTTYVLENPIISDIVITRGWTEPETPEVPGEGEEQEQTPAVRSSRSASKAVSPVGTPEFVKYTEMSNFSNVKKRIVMDGEVITYEKLQENFAKFRKEQSKRMR